MLRTTLIVLTLLLSRASAVEILNSLSSLDHLPDAWHKAIVVDYEELDDDEIVADLRKRGLKVEIVARVEMGPQPLLTIRSDRTSGAEILLLLLLKNRDMMAVLKDNQQVMVMEIPTPEPDL